MYFPKLFLITLSLAGVQLAAVAAPSSGIERYITFLAEYKLQHLDLSTNQLSAIDEASRLAEKGYKEITPDDESNLRDTLIEAFGGQEGRYILSPTKKKRATNDKDEDKGLIEGRGIYCDCAYSSVIVDDCEDGYFCMWQYSGGCTIESEGGCGPLLAYDCDGGCKDEDIY